MQVEKVDLKISRLRARSFSSPGSARRRFRAKQIFKWLYQMDAVSFEEMTNVSKDFRSTRQTTSHYRPAPGGGGGLPGRHQEIPVPPRRRRRRGDGADPRRGAQHAVHLEPGRLRHGVRLLPYRYLRAHPQPYHRRDRQPGLRGEKGGAGEEHRLHGDGGTAGEPRRCHPAVKILTDDGLQFSTRKVTVSTSGLVPEMAELGRAVTVNLAVSLNATTDEVRDRIMPVNRKLSAEGAAGRLQGVSPAFPPRWITMEYVHDPRPERLSGGREAAGPADQQHPLAR